MDLSRTSISFVELACYISNIGMYMGREVIDRASFFDIKSLFYYNWFPFGRDNDIWLLGDFTAFKYVTGVFCNDCMCIGCLGNKYLVAISILLYLVT